MDFKYLSDRCAKGTERVNAFLNDKHRLHSFDNLVMGHAAIVEMQAAMNNQGLLGCVCVRLFSVVQHE